MMWGNGMGWDGRYLSSPSGKGQASQLSRRDFIAGLGAGAAFLLLASCSSGGERTRRDPVAPGATTFIEPGVLSSQKGRLDVTLRAEAGMVAYGSSARYAYTYNGLSPGPTLRVRPGDQLTIRLENGLDQDTNIHTHGLHVSPMGEADNIFIAVRPGGSRRYVYDLPADHRSGLFWYHPHVHGTVAAQVAAGLAGAIIVEDDLDDIPELAASTERVWILADPPLGEGEATLRVSPMERMMGRQGPQVLVNGVPQPRVEATAGQLERWRVVNASASRIYRLGLDGHPLHVISSDGGRLDVPVTVDELLLSPGERTEILVAPTRTGSYALKALAYDRGGAGMGGGMMGGGTSSDELVLATLAVTGTAEAAPLPGRLADPATLQLPDPVSSRTLELGMGMGGGMMGSSSMMSFTIDGRTFDPDRVDVTGRIGDVEEWTIRNTTGMDHPFHLHTWPFQVVDGRPWAAWKDTVNVPAASQVPIRIPFVRYDGRTVYHCHILDHEDLGMMGVIDITA